MSDVMRLCLFTRTIIKDTPLASADECV